MRSTSSPRSSCVPKRSYGAEAVWPYYYAGTMGHVMRDGIHRLRHVKRYSNFHETICNNPAWAGFAAGTGLHCRARSARDGEVRSRGDLGDQRGQHPGQRDDARDPCPQGARRQDRGRRHLHERHHGAGRPAGADPARHRRRARLRGDALPVPRRQGRLGLSRTLHRRTARVGRTRSAARPAMGRGDHRLRCRHHRGLRQARRRNQARLFPPRLWILALAQRLRQHARGKLHSGGDRRLAARRGRGLLQQPCDLSPRQEHDRGARRARSLDPRARSVARRRRAVRRS